MEINNYNQILDHLHFESEDDFYFLQILKRRKDNPNLIVDVLVINTMYINSKEHLALLWGEIVSICKITNSRAYINLNKRSFEDLSLKVMKRMLDQMINKDYRNMAHAFATTAGKHHAEIDKKWIVDIDGEEVKSLPRYLELINICEPMGAKIIDTIPTPNGLHIICNPFNIQEFEKKVLTKTDIHKNNPTILYYLKKDE